MADITLKNVYKIYDNKVTAVTDFNLEIKDKEFIVFVGPSGCGKSTTLRMIAGLEKISSGTLSIGGKVVNDVAPKDRDIAMVFQNYALYPHMNVYNNMAFGLKLRKFPKSEIDRRVMEASTILGLETMLSRKPKAMSGGQRQRVALGRAIVRDPQVFLMDEPLSNLDAKLRVQMRAELIKLHNRLQTTTIYVTHDQTEAMTMASRIVIMKDGFIQQVGTPKEVYDNPTNMFVGSFIGSPSMNFLYGKLRGNTFYLSENKKIVIPDSKIKCMQTQNYQNKEIVLGIRPEALYLDNTRNQNDKHQSISVKVEVVELMGAESIIYAKAEDQDLIARIDSNHDVSPGQNIQLSINLDKVHFFDPETEACLSLQNEGEMKSVPV